jgi:hypothetical protein
MAPLVVAHGHDMVAGVEYRGANLLTKHDITCSSVETPPLTIHGDGGAVIGTNFTASVSRRVQLSHMVK